MTHADDLRTQTRRWRLIAAVTAVAMLAAMLVAGPGVGTAHADVLGYQLIDPETGEPVGDPVFDPEFPLDITLIVVGGNVVLNEGTTDEDGDDPTGACVDFGLEGLCEPTEEPDPDAEPITLSGQILDADGTLVIPAEGVSFPETDPEFLDDIGVWLGATIEFPEGVSGQIDPETGAMQLAGLLTFALTFFENSGGEPGNEVAKCTVGADVDAVHDDPGKPTTDPTVQVDDWPAGEEYDDETGVSRPAHSDFIVDGPLVQSGDGTEPGTCDEGFFGGVVMGNVNETLGISDGPNDENYIGLLNQSNPVLLGEIPTDPIVSVDPLAARDGDTVTITGQNFSEGGATAELCDNGDCDPMDNQALSVDAEGNLSGTADVPAGTDPGDYILTATDDAGNAAATSFRVLGEATITLSPDSGSPGSTVNITGQNFDPNEQHDVFVHAPGEDPLSGSPGADSPTSDDLGNLSTSVTVTEGDHADFADADDQVSITVTNGQSASALFTVVILDDFCLAATADNPAGTCSLQQEILLDVVGGDLTMEFLQAGDNPSNTVIRMSEITLDGTDQTSEGVLNTVRITDFRGNLGGWTVTGEVTDLEAEGVAGGEAVIGAENISWINLTCEPADENSIGDEVSAGDGGVINTNDLLCEADPGGGQGTFDADAEIRVAVSAQQPAGDYSGALTITLVGHN